MVETRGRRRSKIGYQIHPKKERRVGHIDGPAIVTFFKAFFFHDSTTLKS